MRKTRKRTRTRGGATSRGLVGTLFKGTQRLPAHVSEEPEWYLDGAEVKLTRVFTIVLILHLVAVGGILAFKMIEKASVPAVIVSTGSGNEAPTKEVVKKAPSPAKVAKLAPTVKEPLKIERKKSVVVEDPSRKGLAVYRVSNGETLVSVARDLGVTVSELRKLNDLHTGDELYAGKWLSVPDKKKASIGGSTPKPKAKVASAPKTLKAVPIGGSQKAAPVKAKPVKAVVAKPVSSGKKAAPSQNKNTGTYVVKSGDNLYKISRITGVGYSTLINMNKLDKPELLQVGQVLKIPGE